MIMVDPDERKWYENDVSNHFAEDVINDMFKNYFKEIYQENAVKRRLSEIWEKITIKIPKYSVFVIKDSTLYSLTSDLNFEIAPEDFFEIDEVSHPILIECFEKCYSKFKDLIKNYKKWEFCYECGGENSLVNIGLTTKKGFTPWVQDLNFTLGEARSKFDDILCLSLKSKLLDKISPKIIEVYKSALLQNDPVMLVTRNYNGDLQKIYAITENLEAKEVTYSLIERELEEIIHEVVPEDTDFLVNRIYNSIMLPLKEVNPCIRINHVKEKGINATIYLAESDLPVVCGFSLKYFYAFLKTEHNSDYFPFSRKIRYCSNYYINTKIRYPEDGLEIIQKINQEMFNNISCYVELVGKKYSYYWYDNYFVSQRKPTNYNILYRLENGKVIEVFDEEIRKNEKEEKSFNSLMKKIDKKIEEERSYAFWEITFGEKI